MITIPGKIIAFLTLPGILIHELAHWLGCLLCGVRVLAFSYNEFGGNKDAPVGYVVHELTDVWWKTATIAAFPLFLNIPLAVGIIALLGFEDSWKWLKWLLPLYYFAFSVAFHSIPSWTDNRNLLDSSFSALKINKGNIFALFFVVLGGVVQAFLFLRRWVPNFIVDILFAVSLFAGADFLRRALISSVRLQGLAAGGVFFLVVGAAVLLRARSHLSIWTPDLRHHVLRYSVASAGVCAGITWLPLLAIQGLR